MSSSNSVKRKVLLIGWDAADWRVINPLIDQGLMPNLERMVNGGVIGRLATLDPPLSPMLWTSIATGKRPYKHGILGFTEVGPDGKVRPITNLHRRVKAIWNILTQEGARTHVVGWWPSHPAEPISGIMVSNFYQRATRPITEPWTMRQGTVHPAGKSRLFADFRIHPGELTAAHIAPFVPDFALVDQGKEKELEAIARVVAECSTVHAAATYIMEHEPWDFMAVYYDAIDHFKHGFMKYHPPWRPFIPERSFELYHDVVTAGYRYHDMMLGRLLQLAGEEATVMLISDHGFHADHLRPTALPKEPAGPMWEHGPYGIFCVKGPGIKKDALIHGAGLLDITPTLLTLFGLPVATDMDGKPLLDVFQEPTTVGTIGSWDTVEGECGMHPRTKANSALSEMDDEALRQLIELGYIEDPGSDPEKASVNTVRENQFYLAKAYIHGGLIPEALDILLELYALAPDQVRYGMELARAHLRLHQPDDAQAVLDSLQRDARERHEGTRRAQLAAEKGEDIGPYVVETRFLLLQATILQASQRTAEALPLLQRIEQIPAFMDRVQFRLATAYMDMRQWKDATTALTKALEHDPASAKAHHALGVCCLKTGSPEQAVDHLHEALGLDFNMPIAHYHLGEAYQRIGEHEKALQAFEVCLRMSPGVGRARMRMADILEKDLGQPERAAALRAELYADAKGEVITVVSGLPRSGTSMMMQALVGGGMEPFMDGRRKADESNPKGYFEHEAVKALARDPRVMEHAQGKVVKVVAPLLPFLPPRFRYRVILMERDMYEVLRSQNSMLQRGPGTSFRTGLVGVYAKQMEKVDRWCKRNSNVEVLRVGYQQVVAAPDVELERVNAFVGGALDVATMVKAVDPQLYRNRSAHTTAQRDGPL
ncbi:MAG: alkaline phosphatase family protein [Flavobacteriales bacterium]